MFVIVLVIAAAVELLLRCTNLQKQLLCFLKEATPLLYGIIASPLDKLMVPKVGAKRGEGAARGKKSISHVHFLLRNPS